ncbi:NUDIX domain-containing protein [Cohnella endophytica]|uniref:NUDIX domain-containing protein n=1 Tax=Cohnella endophytica TaxID=2419778 RepID=A0A494XY34_9BACL|nr:NUDIX hydrolase [Cohnella endophytica]RKP53004.1 NUDIX domain-containing protein [Cohnella endophytica]
MEINFCSSCGAGMENRDVDGTIRRACTKCTFVHWGNYSIGVGALVMKDERVLLVRRAQEPGKGYWTNPGGYIEQLEPIEETVRREVLEECGVEARVRSVVALRDQPRGVHNVYVAFSMDYMSGEPTPDNVEVDAAGFYRLEEMREMNVAPFTKWLVDVALNGVAEGLAVDREPIVPLHGYGLFRV